MVGEMVFIREDGVGLLLIDKSLKLSMFTWTCGYACIHCLILNKEVHRYRTVKIESLAMYIFWDSKKVCVKLDNGLTEMIASSFCSSFRNF